MLPMLLPLVTALAPSLTDWLFGAKAAKTTTAITGAIQAVTGVDVATAEGAAAATAMLGAKPELAVQLQTNLQQIAASMRAEADREADAKRQSELDALRAVLTDTQNARQQTLDLAKDGSDIAWSAPVLSGVILTAFASMITIVLFKAVPSGSESLANVLLGTLAAMATQVANYWLGSSNGSRTKDKTNLVLATKSPQA